MQKQIEEIFAIEKGLTGLTEFGQAIQEKFEIIYK